MRYGDAGKQNMDKGLSLARRVRPKYSPVFDKLSEANRAAVALYFLPHTSEKDVLEVTRPRVIKWYCPFADQRETPFRRHGAVLGAVRYLWLLGKASLLPSFQRTVGKPGMARMAFL
jgi:hypothetical protein